ncbi:hypothetical protein EG830_09260, partial [bacterium]|nr:hypothetical protein [bacterium]
MVRDQHCPNPPYDLNNCTAIPVYNDYDYWIVGDHKYENGVGRFSLEGQQVLDYIRSSLNNPQTIDYQQAMKLMSVLTGSTNEEKLSYLKSIMDRSNAADMADFFYTRAQNYWISGYRSLAMHDLGIALHLVQDLTEPHHADLDLNLTSDETVYEQDIYDNFATYSAQTFQGDYSVVNDAMDLAIGNAAVCS